VTFTFLGTGTSQGVPVVGCTCAVCQSPDSRDKRLRSSVMIVKDDYHLLIDVSPDLRQQLLANQFDKIDSICITHEHNDHVSGIDDIRPVNFKWGKEIPIFTLQRVIDELQNRFYYAFETKYAARPRLSVSAVNPGKTLQLGPFRVEVVAVEHGHLDILGFIVDDIAYLTDVKNISSSTIEKIADCRIVILSALHRTMHNSHQSLDEALALIDRAGFQKVFLTHLAHQMGKHAEVDGELPSHVRLAYDGLVLS